MQVTNAKIELLKLLLEMFADGEDKPTSKEKLIMSNILDDIEVQNVLMESIKTDNILKEQLTKFIKYFEIDIVEDGN